MADVIAILFEWQMLLPFFYFGRFLMLQYTATVLLADVIAMWQMEKPLDWCYIYVMADVIAQWQME